MTSTTWKNKNKRRIKIWAVAVWLVIWQAASMWIGQEILLVSPVTVLATIVNLASERDFCLSILSSLMHIIGGFLLAVLVGTVLASFAAVSRRVREFLEPFIVTVKSIPVASFVILVLIWVSSRNLSVVISFLMVFPIIYTNVLDGMSHMDMQLKEMADVFQISAARRVRWIYLSQILPFFRTGCSLGLGLCWKAGVAAEVIGIPQNSIGENLYNAKIYLDTADLFAWTMVIICISVLFEKGFLKLIDIFVTYLNHMK